jgi:Gamma-aminobutyrate permease and related permeases
MELIGVSAGETENPQKTLVQAIKSMIWRILIFYISAIFVILCIYPWDKLCEVGSPFVQTFAKFGIPLAAGLINFVVITAALLGANSGIYSSSRMLHTLADKKQLPHKFTLLGRNGIPIYSVLAVSCGIFWVFY